MKRKRKTRVKTKYLRVFCQNNCIVNKMFFDYDVNMYNLPHLPTKTTHETDLEAEILAYAEKIGLGGILSESELIQHSRSWGGCDVYKWHAPNGRECLVKSYRERSIFIRFLYGRRALRNEDAKLRLFRSAGIRVPQPFGLLGKDTLLEEYLVDGNVLLSLRHYTEETKPSQSFFKKLSDLIFLMHDRGICHGDFHRANIMILNGEEPCLLDVATAVCLSEKSSWVQKFLFGIFRRADEYSLAKIVETYYPEMIEGRLKEALDNAPWYLKLGSFLRHRIYRRVRGKRKRPRG